MKLLKLLFRAVFKCSSEPAKLDLVLPFLLAPIVMISGFAGSIIIPSEAEAAVEVLQFEDRQQGNLYRELIQELRCLVCQNQNLADSNAELAKDLRRKTREMVEQGKSRQEIVDYMVSRYGEFVLYRPPVNKKTYILWFSPLILFIAALGFLFWSRNRKAPDTKVFSEAELTKAHDLMGSEPEAKSSESHSADKIA